MAKYKTKQKISQPQKVNNSNDLLFAFWGIAPIKKHDNTVYVWTDPSILHTVNPKKTTFENIDNLKEFESKQSRMGYIRSQQKQERMMQLRQLIDDGQITTIQQAIKKIPDIQTDKTIVRYLKIIGRELIDERTGNLRGSKIADFSESQTKKNKKQSPVKYKFYTCDPNQNGIELSQDEYIQYRNKLLNKNED